jgi:hypothetical protein
MKSYIAHEDCFPKGITLQGFWTLGHALEPWFPSPARELVFRPSKGALRDYLGQKFLNLPEEIFQMILWDYAPRSTLARLGVALQFKSDIIKSLDCVPVEQSLQFDFLNPLLRFFALDFLGVRYRPYVSKTAKIGDSSVIRVALDHFGIRSVEILEEYPSTNSSRSQPGTWYILEHLSQARRKFKLFSAVCGLLYLNLHLF